MTAAVLALIAVQQQAAPAAPAAPDTGRTGRPCRVAIDSVGGTGSQQQVGAGRRGREPLYNYFAGGGVWAHCEGTTSSLTADSVAWYALEQRLDLVGSVRIRDDIMHLDAATMRYFTKDERLEAYRDVVAVNRRTGTALKGPNLVYLRAAQGVRDTTEMFASSRPTIDYRAAGDSGEPYVIVADRVRMKGDTRMWGGGAVTVDRSDLAARADSMMMDDAAGAGLLVGQPRVAGKGERAYTLTGARIELEIDSSEVRVVKALHRAEATGADWRLVADTIHLLLADRRLQQTLAWGDSLRPRAVSSQQTVEADSLVLDTPREVLTELRAFGRALSTARRDTTAAADVDWIAGDTLVAKFVQAPDTARGGTKSEVRQIVAHGSARALTHLYQRGEDSAGSPNGRGEPGAPPAPPDINYSRGTSIEVTLKGDRIDRVTVAGRADGVHLERRPPAPPASDTTKASP